ncbi:anthranilate phosphoribosyltransferase, partial [Candidatus Parvarchaeota archaeon]|nr:anthranilate phosphoribosyltransferase [Candidatus Parvarchaeota archaeon]
KGLGAQKALLVSSDIDEISVSAPSQVYEISKGKITNYEINPEDFGINKSGLDSLRVAGAAQSATVINSVLSGKEGPARDIVLMNSAAAIYVSGLAASLKNGFEMAQASIDSGKAFEKLEQLKGFGKSIVK